MKKPLYYYRQSGVIPYRYNDGSVDILLITSRKKKRWVIPKGIVEEGMSAQDSAGNEALEEAGARGDVDAVPIGDYEYAKWDGVCRVQVFPMFVTELTDEWLEAGFRNRAWFTAEEAVKKIEEDGLKEIIVKFIKMNLSC